MEVISNGTHYYTNIWFTPQSIRSILRPMTPHIGLIGSGAYGQFKRTVLAGLPVDFSIIGPGEDSSACSHVVVATPNDTHFDLSLAALRAGQHVLCEKPLALSLDHIAALEAAAQDAHLFLGVGFVLHNHPFYRAIKALQSTHGPLRAMRVYNHATEGLLESPWYWDASRSGGWFMVSEIHWYHLFSWLTEIDLTVLGATEEKTHDRTQATWSQVVTKNNQTLIVDHRLDSTYATCWTKVELDFADVTLVIDDWVPHRLRVSRPLPLVFDHEEIHLHEDDWLDGRTRDQVYRALVRANVEQLLAGEPVNDPTIQIAHRTALAAQQKADLNIKSK